MSSPTRRSSRGCRLRRSRPAGTGCSCGITCAGTSRSWRWRIRGSRWRQSPRRPGGSGSGRWSRRAARYQGFRPVNLDHPGQLAQIVADLSALRQARHRRAAVRRHRRPPARQRPRPVRCGRCQLVARRVSRPEGHRGPGTGSDPRRPRSPILTWPAGPASCVPVPPGRQIQTPVWSRIGLRHPPGSDLASPDTGPGGRCARSGTEITDVRTCRSSGQVQVGRMRFSRRVNARDLNEARIPADLAGRRGARAHQAWIWIAGDEGRAFAKAVFGNRSDRGALGYLSARYPYRNDPGTGAQQTVPQ